MRSRVNVTQSGNCSLRASRSVRRGSFVFDTARFSTVSWRSSQVGSVADRYRLPARDKLFLMRMTTPSGLAITSTMSSMSRFGSLARRAYREVSSSVGGRSVSFSRLCCRGCVRSGWRSYTVLDVAAGMFGEDTQSQAAVIDDSAHRSPSRAPRCKKVSDSDTFLGRVL